MKKRLLQLSFLCIIITCISSCKKFLDEQPITEIGPELVFKDVNTTLHALAGVYAQLAGDQGYGKVLSLYFPVDTDETQGPTGGLDNARREISRYTLTASNTEIQRPFEQCFRGIEFANICLANIPKMGLYANGSANEKAQLKRMYGEALTLRAQFYFEAIRNWGDLPAHFIPAAEQALADPFPRRVNRDTLYNQILNDLKSAEDMVPWIDEVTAIGDQQDERITKGTVKGLRARIALFRGGYSLRNATQQMQRSSDYLTYYQIAKEECAEIMAAGKHALNPSFKALWKNGVGAKLAVDPQNELMFQVGAIGSNAVADTKLGYYNGPTVAGLGNKSINILPTYFYTFDSADLRRDVTCIPYTVGLDGVTKTGVGISSIVDGKYRRDWISNPVIAPTNAVQYFGLKWQLLRYADVLLMFAEAENEINGPTAIAFSAVNKVRRRGFGKPIDVPADIDLIGLNKQALFDAIVKERSFELGGEGIRKYDLIRWNLLGTKLNETKLALNDLQNRVGVYTDFPTSMYYKNNSTADDGSLWANSFYFPAPSIANAPAGCTRISWIGSSITSTILGVAPNERFAKGYTPNKSELLPIPQASRGSNFNLSQNPGY
jgi:starch-binding outer membrane protein, SusD/RagB family